MREVHAMLATLRRRRDPLTLVARRLAARGRLLCLDELLVGDIADAMILGGLFEALLAEGVTLVMTSNTPPQELYRDGLQRARFLPAIALIERELDVVRVDGGADYRLRELRRRPIYVASDAPDAQSQLATLFDALSDARAEHEVTLTLQGRRLKARRRRGSVVWFDFATLCEGARSQNDYVELAQEFQTVLLSAVPVFSGPRDDDAARRFIALVDELYDQGVKLVMSAAAAPEGLYRGERLRASFARTASRLVEMQTEGYLARAHRREDGGS
jgi:cell division protein ZapE